MSCSESQRPPRVEPNWFSRNGGCSGSNGLRASMMALRVFSRSMESVHLDFVTISTCPPPVPRVGAV